MGKIVFPAFSGEDYQPFEVRQLVSALELRFQDLESSSSALFDTDVSSGLDGRYSQLGHTHSESEISNLQAYLLNLSGESIFDLSDVSGTPADNDILLWDAGLGQFVTSTLASVSVTLNSLIDVSVPAPANGEVLTYNSVSTVWESMVAGASSSSFLSLTDTDLSGQTIYDLVFNADGTEWQDTAGLLQWNPTSAFMQLANAHSINWLDLASGSVQLLTLGSTVLASSPMDFYQNAATVHSTTTSATYVDVVNGAQISQAAMTVGDDYLVFHQGVIHGLGAVGAYRLLASGVVLAGSTTTFTGVQTATTDPDGHPYGYAGWFTADGGADFKAQHHRQAGTSTTEALSQSFLLNLTTDCPNHIKDQSITTTSVGAPPFTLTDCAVVLPAGDWLLFISARIDFPTNAGFPEIGINDGTTDFPLMGRMRAQAGNQLNSGAMFYLDGYAGGTVTIIASSTSFTLDIDYKCIVAIPLSDFSEAYAVQDVTQNETAMSARNVDEVITTLSVPSITNTSTDFFAFGFGSHNWNGSDPSIGFEILSNVNAGGDTKIGWDNGRNHRISANSGVDAREGQPTMSDSTISLTAGDSIDIKVNAVSTETSFTSHKYSQEGAALILLATASTLVEGFTVGDPLFNTTIDGLATNITSASTDIDGTLNVDGASTFISTMDVTGAATFGSTMDVTGIADFNANVELNTGAALTIWDATNVDNAIFSHDGTDFNLAFLTTADWNITGLTGDFSLAGTLPVFKMEDTDASVDIKKYRFRNSNGIFALQTLNDAESGFNTAFQVTRAGATPIALEVVGGTDLDIRDSGILFIRDSGDTDWGAFSHDGTDFNTAFTNTADWNITGLTGGTMILDGSLTIPEKINVGTIIITTTTHTAANQHVILVDDDTAAATVTVTLPIAATKKTIYHIKKLGSTALVIIDGDAAETIDGGLTATLTTQYESIMLVSDGVEWHVL